MIALGTIFILIAFMSFLGALSPFGPFKRRSEALGTFLLTGIVGLVCFVSSSQHSMNASDAPRTDVLVDAPVLPKQDQKQVMVDARKYMAKRDFEGVLMEIDALDEDHKHTPEADKLYNKAYAMKDEANLKNGEDGRKAYAKLYEKSLLTNGADASVTTGGRLATTLNITYVLVNRPLVWQTENDLDLTKQWSTLGFVNVHMSDGYENSWTFKL